MKNNKILLKGPYLPSIGGVSIHISRLAESLSNDGLLSCLYITTNSNGLEESRFITKNVSYPKLKYVTSKSLLWFILYGIKDNSKVFHIHGNPIWESPTLVLLLLLKKKLVFTIHDQMMLSNLNKYPGLLLCLFKKIIVNKNIHWIVVNPNIKRQIDLIRTNCTNINVIPAYIPSFSDDIPLNPEIECFIKNKSKIISIYAHSELNYYGKDLYGIKLAIKAIKTVKKTFPDIGLIISIPCEELKEEINQYQRLINELHLYNNVIIFLNPINNPLNLWSRSDIVLRPTLTDGDSLVVREAISQGTFVIASDVVQRPEGVILFKSENIEDLSSKIIETLNYEKPNLNKTTSSNYELIKKVYSSF